MKCDLMLRGNSIVERFPLIVSGSLCCVFQVSPSLSPLESRGNALDRGRFGNNDAAAANELQADLEAVHLCPGCVWLAAR